MAHTRKLHYKDVSSDPATYVGNQGDVFFDPRAGSLRYSDGSTQGGFGLASPNEWYQLPDGMAMATRTFTGSASFTYTHSNQGESWNYVSWEDDLPTFYHNNSDHDNGVMGGTVKTFYRITTSGGVTIDAPTVNGAHQQALFRTEVQFDHWNYDAGDREGEYNIGTNVGSINIGKAERTGMFVYPNLDMGGSNSITIDLIWTAELNFYGATMNWC